MREIDGSGLRIDHSNSFLKSNPFNFNYEFTGVSEPVSEYEKYKWVLSAPIPKSLKKSQHIFGQPDAYDQCGYYLVFSVNSSDIKILVDPDKVPSELVPLVDKLFHRKQ